MKSANIKVIENEWITLADGRRLSARIWIPKNTKKDPIPAILEYLPYRKHDGTAQRDESTYPEFAEAGYAGVRVDISGTGEAEMPGHGLRHRHRHQECWSINNDDPLSYQASSQYISWMSRGDWSIRTESESSFRCDAENFYISATVTAFESDQQINQRSWEKAIKRDLI